MNIIRRLKKFSVGLLGEKKLVTKMKLKSVAKKEKKWLILYGLEQLAPFNSQTIKSCDSLRRI